MQNKKIIFKDLGTNLPYDETWKYQDSLLQEIVEIKRANAKLENENKKITPNYLLFLEHAHVYTLGKNGKINHLLAENSLLKEIDATFYHINRGGDITYHGPGQIVGYPIIDLDNFFTDIHKYLRYLEEVVIKTLAYFNIDSQRSKGETGVWLDVEKPYARKICAMGIRASRWVTMHGFALNVNTDLSYFNHIVPCGIANKAVTSIENELKTKIKINLVKDKLLYYFEEVFECSSS
ncbi:MAG: lipoyl(octanoyl) transferase LipB [Solirubrobacteraceae bacterium]|jgi:lipoyl(octanoyl) transferase